jgi:hypothetical protein
VAQLIPASAASGQVLLHLRSLKDRKIAKHMQSQKHRTDVLGLLLVSYPPHFGKAENASRHANHPPLRFILHIDDKPPNLRRILSPLCELGDRESIELAG